MHLSVFDVSLLCYSGMRLPRTFNVNLHAYNDFVISLAQGC